MDFNFPRRNGHHFAEIRQCWCIPKYEKNPPASVSALSVRHNSLRISVGRWRHRQTITLGYRMNFCWFSFRRTAGETPDEVFSFEWWEGGRESVEEKDVDSERSEKTVGWRSVKTDRYGYEKNGENSPGVERISEKMIERIICEATDEIKKKKEDLFFYISSS